MLNVTLVGFVFLTSVYSVFVFNRLDRHKKCNIIKIYIYVTNIHYELQDPIQNKGNWNAKEIHVNLFRLSIFLVQIIL